MATGNFLRLPFGATMTFCICSHGPYFFWIGRAKQRNDFLFQGGGKMHWAAVICKHKV